jgi:hypothetical protein
MARRDVACPQESNGSHARTDLRWFARTDLRQLVCTDAADLHDRPYFAQTI